jgi:hypothetical protein
VTSKTPDRAWYSVSSKGLLEGAKFVKDFSAEIGGTLKNLGSGFWPGFQADGHSAVIGLRASTCPPRKLMQNELELGKAQPMTTLS